MKENDYILANILNPEFSNQDFKDILGMNMENTQILPYSSYTSSPLITQNELFQDDNGNFNERKFKDFYTTNVGKFASFNVDQPIVENFEYGIFDSSRKQNSRVKDPNFKLSVISNPDRITTGISGRNQREDSKLSRGEMAQQSKIWDTEKGKWLDYSPNDISLVKSPLGWFKSLFDEPLVKATWDEEGDHKDPITKRTVHHYKGDLKLNDEGQYFYETLGDRSPIGKEILSSFDILTVDGEGINKYDFIDSDGLDKSVTGTIAKTALTVAPLFLGGPASLIYSGALIAREMSKSLPMLYGMVSSLWGNEEDSRLLNTIAAYGEKFTTGTSEYSRQNTFTFENIASLIGDVATQWGQQKAIAESINKLRGSKSLVDEAYKKAAAYYALEAKSIEQGAISSLHKGQMKGMSALQYIGDPKEWQNSALGKAAIKKFVEPAQKIAKSNARLGADASLAYMAIISNTDVYQSMLEHGASKRDAAAVAFGSTLGMFAVDRYLGLGELFFDELRNDARLAMRGAFKRETDAIAERLIGTTGEGLIANPEVKQNALKSLIQKGINLSKGVTGKFADDVKNHTTGFFGKAFGEGLEEVSEELVTDLSKQLYELAGEFSPNFINTSGITDVGAWENAKERYLMSLLGGAIGGGLFYGVGVFQNGTFKRDTTQDELIYLIANNKTQEVLKELDKWKAAGKFGSKTLSASKYEYNSDGKPVFLTADSEDDSQNTYIYNRIKESVFQLENILNTTGTNLSEDDLFKQMVLSEQRFLNLKEVLQDQAYSTKYQEKFRTLTRDLINAEMDLSNASKSMDGTPTGQQLPDSPGAQVLNDPVRLANIEKYQQKVDDLKAQRDSFLNGEQSLPHTKKMLFAIDKYLNSSFISMTFDQWLKANKGKDADELTSSERETFKEEYLKYKQNKQPWDLDQAFSIYEQIEKLVNPHISELAQNAGSFIKNHDVLQELFTGENNPLDTWVQSQLTFDSRLEDDTDDTYNNRNIQLEGEDDQKFKARKDERQAKVDEHNQKTLDKLKSDLLNVISDAGGYIDPSTQRYIHRHFKVRRGDIAQAIIDNFIEDRQKSSDSRTKSFLEVMKKLNPNMSNYQDVLEELIDIAKKPHRENIQRRNKDLEPVLKGLTRMFDDFGYSYDPNTINGNTVLGFMSDLASRIASGDSEIEGKFLSMDPNGKGYLNYLMSIKDSEDLVGELMRYEDQGEETLLEYYLGAEYGSEVEPDEWIPIATSINEGQENYDMHLYSDEEINTLVEEKAIYDIDYVQLTMSQIKDAVQGNSFVKMLDEVDKAVTSTNPITQLLKQINVALDPQNRSIEQILDSLHQKLLNADSVSEFTLTEDEEYSLREAAQLLSTVRAYLYAAGTDVSFSFPVGHNKVINEFAKNHPDVYKDFEELPTLDQSVADMYISEIDKYLVELSDDDSNPFSWIALSNSNKINKRQRLINTEKKFNEAKLELLKVLNNSDSVKCIINGQNIDLLEGFDSILDDDLDIKLYKIENLFYNNLHKYLEQGISLSDILKETHLLEVLPGKGTITSQITSELDDTISYGNLTKFDSFVYLLTIAGISSKEFSKFIKDRVQESDKETDINKKIVPLTIQEQTSRIALAQIKSKQLFSEALQYLKESSKDDREVLDYLVFIDGSAGAGKTQVIARNAAKYIQSDKIWLSAPKETQLKTLKSALGKGEGKLRTDLFNLILDPGTYSKLLTQMNVVVTKGNEQSALNTDLFSTKTLPDGNKAQILNKEAIKFNEIKDLPELIIIDEVTHFSGLELQILNEFAKKNSISIIALGDTNQSGFKGISKNIDREKIIAVRSPKLSISLRDVNLQKQENLTSIQYILNALSKSEVDDTYEQKLRNFAKLIGRLRFKVYKQEILNGDLLTDTLTSEQVGKLYGTVGYVGSTSSDTYKILSEHGENIKEVIQLTPDEIQGQEFDYIVVDDNWELDLSNITEDSSVPIINFLTKLYTLMSRGKEGSIFIDKGLSNIIGKNQESFSRQPAPNLKDALEPFFKAKIESLEKLGLKESEEPEKQTTSDIPNPEPKKEEDDQGEPSGENEFPNQDEPLGEDESLQDDDEPESDEETEQDRKNMYESLGDKTDEKVQEQLDRLELDPQAPIRIYGSAHFSGLRPEKRQVDGKETTIYTNPHSEVRRDLQVFMKGDEANGTEMHRLVTSLLNLKSAILYDDDFEKLPSSVTSVVTPKNLKDTLTFKIEVRPKETEDTFVGFTGLDEEGIAIDGLVYTIVAEFKDNEGKQCKVTLGLLADPKSYVIYKKNGESEADFNTRKAQAQPKIDRYRTLFDNITKSYHDNGSFYQDITPQFSGLTHIRRTTGVGANRRPVPILTLEEYRARHPYSVISSPYIFTGKNFKGLKTDKIRGHAVIFVSDDLTLSPDELMDIYIRQKEDTNANLDENLFNLSTKPRVRMLTLDSQGVSFRSLAFTKKMKDLYSTEQTIGGKQVIKMFPFEEDYMGIRMITSLWNYRANLRKFIKYYEDWKAEKGYSDDDVSRIALYADALYKQNNPDSSNIPDRVSEILRTTKATDEEIKELQKFNDSLALQVRQFRLGGSRSSSGVYLRNLSNIKQDNVFYKGLDKTPIGIYINPQTAYKHLDLINALLDDTFGSIINPKRQKVVTGEGGRITQVLTDEPWPIDMLLSPKDGYTNSLSGMIKDIFGSQGNLIFEEDGVEYNLQFPTGNNISVKKQANRFPILLRNLYIKILAYQGDPVENEYENLEIGKGTDSLQQFNWQKLRSLIEVSDDGYDSSFDDMLALAFHGTTDNPNPNITVPGKPGYNRHSTMRATDAYFKYGLFVDPMAAEVVGTSGSQALFRRCLTNEALFTVNAEIDMPIFTVTLGQLEQTINQSNTEQIPQDEIIPQDVKDFFSNPNNVPADVIADIEDLYASVKSLEEFKREVSKILNSYTKGTSIPAMFSSKEKPTVILSKDWEINESLDQGISVQQHLEQLSGKSLEGAIPTWDNQNLVISLSDGLTHLEVSYDKFSKEFKVSTIVESTNQAEEITYSEQDKVQAALKIVNDYIWSDQNLEKLNNLESDFPDIYENIISGLGNYSSLDLLMDALNTYLERTEGDEAISDIIIEISEKLDDTLKNCKI